MATVTIKLVDEQEGVSILMDCNESPDKVLTPAMVMAGSFADFVTALRASNSNAVSSMQEQDRCH